MAASMPPHGPDPGDDTALSFQCCGSKSKNTLTVGASTRLNNHASSVNSEWGKAGYEHIDQTPKPKHQNPKPKTQTPKPKHQNPKPKTQTPKPKTQNPKPKTQNPKPKTQNGQQIAPLAVRSFANCQSVRRYATAAVLPATTPRSR
ncbi:hypothetical protein VC218_01385 [Xanthomonas nasturtii]|uniref:hypothetical protein n=1 Tax=Xanthomonas nasturtii TaxID=1843581 RepID=UPI002B235FF0|nr:hypothetical protein [Xanthomonas nasturtii]MEA9577611.1 hypothetical protein [Xanthomonas nasturtii]